MRKLKILAVFQAFHLISLFGLQGADSKFTPEQIQFFELKIRPVLADKCYSCHSHKAKKVKGKLYLDSRAGVIKGGENGPSIVLGKPVASLFMEGIQYKDPDFQMPPKSKLTHSQIKDFERWITEGAPWPNEPIPTSFGSEKEFDLAKRRADHWSWKPLTPPTTPKVNNKGWSSHPVDRFILNKLESVGLKPVSPADRRTLIRRLTFALHGLPPSQEDIQTFLKDKSAEAVGTLVDRLLDSPRFGERWARHWLDLVRYAESRGHEFDYNAANAHRYRDYIIRAFNSDVPYDKFVTEHIAGDLIPNPRLHPEQNFNESILGTGFWFLGEWIHSPVDIRQDEADRFDNMVDVASKAFLGLTVACARCHDHKFDAISTKDFYAFNGFLQSSNYRQVRYETITHNGKIAHSIDQLERTEGEEALKALMSKLKSEVSNTSEYLLAANVILQEGIKYEEGDISLEPDGDIVFADFEDGSYQGWKATGDAFGDGPLTDKTKPDHQVDIKHHGKFFVNSHKMRNNGKGDAHIGTLTSPAFKVERDYVSFLIDGGSHRGKTCLNLLADGRVVGTAQGPQNNTMVNKFWDVPKFRGKMLQIQAVDNHKGGWGNIGFDHVVFTNHRPKGGGAIATTSVKQKFAETTMDMLKQVAQEKKLDANRLEFWIRAIQAASQDVQSPMHVLALASSGKTDSSLRKIAQRRQDFGSKEGAYNEAMKKLDMVIDYGVSKPHEFLQDGYTFGSGTVRAGQVLWSQDLKRPILGFASYGSARKNPAWHGLRIVDSALDHGGLGYARAGMTLRTPTFSIDHGKVWYLVKGEATAMVVVDSHRMVQGPLHGNVKARIGKEGQLNWYAHHLDKRGQSFVGHRVHVEFTPSKEHFEVVMVVQGDDSPSRDAVLRYLQEKEKSQLVTKLDGTSFSELAESFEKTLIQEGLSWLMANENLWGYDHSSLAVVQDFIAKRNKLISEIRKDSRTAMAIQDGDAENEYVFIRGSYSNKGELVPRRFLEALGGKPIQDTGSGRLQLAEQMVSPQNPYISRVIVNRIWHHLFGRGIVASTDDFGYLGQRPSHPELLDHLAMKFIKDGWSIKKHIKFLVHSQTYQMSSQAHDLKAAKLDPTNSFWHRMPVKRLEGEAIRDSILSISGRMDDRMYGKSVPVYLTSFMTGRGRPGNGPLDGSGRRSVYLSVRRNFLSPMMLAFDTPSPFQSVGRRTVSNVPSQALMLMNDPFVLAEAKRWGDTVQKMGGSIDDRVIDMYEKALAREPSHLELDASKVFLERQSKLNPTAAWRDLAHVLFNTKEFIYTN
ncbi:MAG: DUF1553 domain-containing protein [Opitutae bacterium]|nr:DUF1553 domain-containing protein [Opitutae bacterium]